MPVCTPRKPSVSVTGYFPSLKLGRMVAFESTLERDYLYLLDFGAAVTSFEEQPLTLTYEHSGKTRRYTPDFLVREADREVLVECKPEAKLEWNDNPLKFAAARSFCAVKGWSFRVVTDTELRQGYRLENVKCLTYRARYNPPPDVSEAISTLLSCQPHTLDDILRALPYPVGVVKATACHLAYRHVLWLELDAAPIAGTTLIRLAHSGKRQ